MCLLLDRNDPARVIARSETPFMEPEADYEMHGFYGNCIFTNGQIVDGDRILLKGSRGLRLERLEAVLE